MFYFSDVLNFAYKQIFSYAIKQKLPSLFTLEDVLTYFHFIFAVHAILDSQQRWNSNNFHTIEQNLRYAVDMQLIVT